jgi:hypothetical protein
MRFSDRDRPDHRRATVAAEAARIIQEEGLSDFRAAKAKAAERLGMGRQTPLPTNEEIEVALAERTRIFHGDTQPALLDELRQAAFAVMRDLAAYQPKLAGDVLSGHATEQSAIELHVYADTAEEVGVALEMLGLGYRCTQRRLRLRRDETDLMPGLRFEAHGCEFSVMVLPLRLRGQSPVSPVNGRPMRRAGLKEVAELLSAQRFVTSR